MGLKVWQPEITPVILKVFFHRLTVYVLDCSLNTFSRSSSVGVIASNLGKPSQACTEGWLGPASRCHPPCPLCAQAALLCLARAPPKGASSQRGKSLLCHVIQFHSPLPLKFSPRSESPTYCLGHPHLSYFRIVLCMLFSSRLCVSL